MHKLMEVTFVVVEGILLIKFMRWVFNISSGPMKFVHFGCSAWGRNIIEIAIVIFVIFWILGALLKKE